MVLLSSGDSTDSEDIENGIQNPFQSKDGLTQPHTNQSEQEKSLRITIRVPTRLSHKKRRRRRRIEALESATETEIEDLSSLSDLDEDEETALDESLDSEAFIQSDRAQTELSVESSRLTKRQRAIIDEEIPGSSDLVQLPETVKKRHRNLTEEELALKKNELARRRKNLSEQKLEEEKMETIHKLLNKQATHRYKRIKVEDAESISDDEKNVPKASSPIMSRWLDTKAGTVFGIPQKWLNTNVSVYFAPQKASPPLPRPSCASCGQVGIYTVMGLSIPARACSIPCIRAIQSKAHCIPME